MDQNASYSGSAEREILRCAQDDTALVSGSENLPGSTKNFVDGSESPMKVPCALRSIPERVVATPAALQSIAELQAEHGPVMFYQSGGCCEGSAPMCFPEGEMRIGSRDVKLGEIGGAPFYMSAQQFEYWKHTQLEIDVVKGFGAAFSLEGPGGLQFITRSHVFTNEEIAALRADPQL